MLANSGQQGLDDLCVRFIINLPEEDLSSVARICFQVEEAQWFYEDFIRPLDPNLPSMSLRTFCLRIFQHCPLLASFSVENHTRAFEEFLQYKTRVPVRGAILLNQDMDATVLVKGWKKGANWSFPRGKINKDEDDLDCAVREVWEETGLDLRAAGLVPSEGKPKYIEITMREQQMRLYVFRDVPMDTNFQPQTRKEISKIQWYKLSELPAFRKKGAQNQNQSEASSNANKFYMVAPFLVPLKKWVISQKKIEAKRTAMAGHKNLNPHYSLDEGPTEDDAWPQAAPTVPIHNFGLNTLEGATNELQRLLKVQPPTQGIQSPTSQEDKASALLSMLQVRDHVVVQQQPPPTMNTQLPPTSREPTAGQFQQPRNPHHHTNQPQHSFTQVTQPAPSFPKQPFQHQAGQYGAAQHPQQVLSRNANQQPHPPRLDKGGPGEFDGASQHSQQSHQAPLVHPQPLPPQIQRAMFNKSSFQENPQYGSMHNMPLPSQTQAQFQQRDQRQPLAGYTGPASSGMNMLGSEVIPKRLDGQSMALLNAFKRDIGNSPFAQSVPQQPPAQQSYDSQPSYGAQHRPAPQNQPQPLELAGSATQNASSGIVRSEGSAPADQHRSALLGMFNRGQAEPGVHDSSAPAPHSQPDAYATKQIHQVQRHASVDHLTAERGASQSSNPRAAPNELPALRSHQDQRGLPNPNHLTRASPQARQPSINSNPQSQPVRILQRGQGAEDVGYGNRPEQPPSRASLAQQSHAGSASYASPSMSASHPSPALSQRRPEAAHDQKRQLLSLFGKQQQQQPQPTINTVPQGAGEMAPAQGSPARTGNGTPMSPAEQTFLLDYLQSVTNTASQ